MCIRNLIHLIEENNHETIKLKNVFLKL